MKVIAVTGTPGTGKTTFAKKLAREKKYEYLDVNAFLKKHKLTDGYDRSLQTYVIDPKKMVKALTTHIKTLDSKGVIVDSHLSHELPSTLVDVCYVMTTPLTKLKERLKKRNYSLRKIQDNLDAEIFEVCLREAEEKKHRVLVRRT